MKPSASAPYQLNARSLTWMMQLDAVLVAITAVVLGANAPRGLTVASLVLGAVLAFALLETGYVALRMLRVPPAPANAWLAGLAIAAHMIAGPVIILGWDIAASASLFLVLALVCTVVQRLSSAPRATDDPGAGVALLGAGGFALIWSLDTTHRYSGFAATGTFPLALDAMMHAGLIAEFGDPLAVGHGNSGLAGIPRDLYHFASYAFPGLAERFVGEAPLDALVSVWLPVGILATTIGVFCLGAALGGTGTGALAVALLAAVPDPASYGIKQGFYSFHWLMEVAPGSLYALPVGALSLALLCRWSRRAEAGALVGSFVFLAAMFLLRFHLLVWLAVPWGVAALLAAPWIPKKWKVGLIAGGIVVLPLLMVAYARQEIEQAGLMGFLTNLLVTIHRDMVPNNIQSLVPWLIEHLPSVALVPVLAALSLAAIGGLPLAVFLVLAIVYRRRLGPIDAVPLALLVWAAMLMLLAPSPAPSYGDQSEFRQRGMVLIHAFLCCWNARLLLLCLAHDRWQFALALLPLAVLPIPLIGVAAWKAPRVNWAVTFRQTPIDPALITAAGWLRAHAQPGDIFAMTKLTSRAPNVDDPTILTALSGVPSFMARPGVQSGAKGERDELVRDRLELLDEIEMAPDAAVADALSRAAGITFLVVRGDGPVWDPAKDAAELRAGTLGVWREMPSGKHLRAVIGK